MEWELASRVAEDVSLRARDGRTMGWEKTRSPSRRGGAREGAIRGTEGGLMMMKEQSWGTGGSTGLRNKCLKCFINQV